MRPRFAERIDGAGDRPELDGVADRGTRPVSLDEVQLVCRIPRAVVCAPERQGLAVDRWRGNAALSVGRNAPSVQNRVDVVAVSLGVGEPLHDDETAALAGKEAIAGAVVDLHVGIGERAHLGEAHQLERIEADVDATGQRDVDVAGAEGIRCGRDGQQRRGASTVDGVPAASQVHVVADAASDRVGQCSGERVLVGRGEERLVDLLGLGDELLEGCVV